MKFSLFLLFLFFICTLMKPAQLEKHDHHEKHGKKDHKDQPGERHGNKHGKRRGRVEELLADYANDSSDDEDDEEKGEWLFQLQDVRGNCNQNPCLNNGLCEEKKGRFKCKCPKAYKGRRCENGKTACKKDTCGYGQCVLTSTPPFFECKCKAPFLPPNCKRISPCEFNPCRNGGTCKKDGQNFDCLCLPGFTGKFCQVGPNDCYKGNGQSYRGMVSETEDGHDCLFWNSYFLLNKGTNPFNTLNDPQGLGPHNFCRNPDGDSKPWCFIRSGKKIIWDHCVVRKCPADTTTTAPPKPKPTTAHPTVIHTTRKPTPSGISEGYIPGTPAPGSGSTGTPTPGSGSTGTPTPGSGSTGTPTPGSGSTGTPTPGSDATGSPTPGSDATGSPTPGSDATGSPTPGSDATAEPFPATEAGENTGSARPGTLRPVAHPAEVTVKPTILPLATQFATCGKPQPQRPINRIYGGIKALPGGQPWQASVQVRAKGSMLPFRHVCGGTLIKPCWVLTAGHCIDSKKDFRVVLGSTNLAKPEASQQVSDVVETIVHEQYRETPESVHNDIALLRLKAKNGKCVDESQFVKTACLPAGHFPDGTECSISGWGGTPESLYGSSQLLDADVLLISQDTCSSTRVYGKVIDSNMLCAGYLEGGVDSCQGDSGGPLICVSNQTHHIYGIVSWGDNCGLKNKPGVYTRVTNFVDWINRKTAMTRV